jgi:hypothetical protein
VPSTFFAFFTPLDEVKDTELKKLDEVKKTEFEKLDTVHGNIRDYFPNLVILSTRPIEEIRVEAISEASKTPGIDGIEESMSLFTKNLTNFIHSDYVEARDVLESQAKDNCIHLFGDYETVFFGVSNLNYDVEASTTHITCVATADIYCAIPPSKKVVESNEPVKASKPVEVIPFPDINITPYPYPPPRYRGDAPYPRR